MELLHSTSIPSVEDSETQHGSGVNTRSMKHDIENEGEDEKKDVKIPKTEIGHKEVDTSDEYGGGPHPLCKANFKKLGPAKR